MELRTGVLAVFLAICIATFACAGEAFAAQHPELPPLSHSGLSSPCGVATDSRGNLYVGNGGDGDVRIYNADGSPLAEFVPTANTPFPCGVAVDAFGSVYVASGRSGLLTTSVARYKPSEFPPTAATTYVPDASIGGGTGVLVPASRSVSGVAVDPETQNAYVSEALANEKQRLLFTGFSTAGDMFTLSCPNGETTAPIAYATAATLRANIKAALEAKCGSTFTTASPQVTVTYGGSFAYVDVPRMTCLPTVGSGGCEVTEEVDGSLAKVSAFKPDGTPISTSLAEGLVSGADFFGIDILGASGRIYVADRANNKVYGLNPDGSAIEAEIDGSEAPAGPFTGMVAPTLAIDQSSGHLYVSDIAGHGVVDEFDQNGTFANQISRESPLVEPAPLYSDIAIDNGPASPNRGTVFVTAEVGSVYAFAAQHPELPPLSHSGLSSPCGVATDSRGNLYVGNGGDGDVRIYNADGSPLAEFVPTANTPFPCGVAVDAFGSVYVASGRSGLLTTSVARYKPSEFPPTAATTYVPDASIGGGTGVLVPASRSVSGVAVDPETQNAYVSEALANEKQRLLFTGFSTAGDMFTLSCPNGETTAPIAYATAATLRANIKAALEAKCGSTFTTASPQVTVTYGGSFAYVDVPRMTCLPTVGSGGCEVTEEVDGSLAKVSAFKPDGTPISTSLAEGLVSGADFFGIDILGASGRIYVADRANNKVYGLNPDGSAIEAEIDGSEAPAGPFTGMVAPTLAIDQSSGHLYVSDIAGHGVVDEFDQNGTFANQISRESPLVEPAPLYSDIAIDNGPASPNRGTVFVTAEVGSVYAFGSLGQPSYPLAVKKAGFGDGTVKSSPAGIECGALCEVEFPEGKSVTLTATSEFPAVVASWSGCDSVSGDKAECTVTMDTARSVMVRFASPPTLSGEVAAHRTASSARLEGKVNPNGEGASYQFEYLSMADYEANGGSFSGPNAPIQAPLSPSSIGAAGSPVPVSEQVNGLAPATSYRFRLLASNATGASAGDAKGFATYAPPNSFTGMCPKNEMLRSGFSAGLPDCRAYEQASPVGKNGGNLQGKVPSVKAASSGAAISFESPAGIPGGEGSQEFPTYLASRKGGAWSTQGLLPNANAGQSARLEGWTADFSVVFDSVGKSSANRALVARSSTSGALDKIVDYTSPGPDFSFVGAALDGSKVLFQARGPGGALSPGAVSGSTNLYAWDAATPKVIRFVGFLPNGSGPPGATLAGEFGSDGYTQDTRALSVGADSVYFTAGGSGQLYLRLNPGSAETTETDGKGDCVPDENLACSVHVNASEKTNGGGLEGHDAAGRRPAAFKAASADGSTAYFTSTEKLTDDANTGLEPQPAAIARADLADGANLDLGFLPAGARGVEVRDGYAYWANPGDGEEGAGSIGRAKLGPGGPEDVDPEYVAGLHDPHGVAADAEHVYWTEVREGGEGKGTIGRAKVGASQAEEVDREFISGASDPEGIAVDAGHLYWVNASLPTVASGLPGCVGRADIEGTPGSVEQKFIEFATADVAVTATHIYFSRSNGADGFIRSADLNGTGVENFIDVPGAEEGPAMDLDADRFYWTNPTLNTIGRSDLAGTLASQEQEFITGAAGPHGLALDATHLYWSANQKVVANPGNDLYRFEANAPAGGRLADIAVDSASEAGVDAQGVLGVSVNGSRVYYVGNGIPDGVNGASPNENGETPTGGTCQGSGAPVEPYSGVCNLYLWDEGETTFIARLNASGADRGDFSNWVATPRIDGTFGSSYQRTARVSASGDVLLFRSQRKLTDYDNEGKPELYRFAVGQPELDCISCDPTGAPSAGLTALGSIRTPVLGAPSPAFVLSRNLSADGGRVFFETADALVAADTNGLGGCPTVGSPLQSYAACQDVYEWEASGKGSCKSETQNGGCLYLLSTGKDEQPSFFGDANESGDDAFIFTSAQLVPQDQDNLLDAYDVRVGGGLTGQHANEGEPCSGEACIETPAQAPRTTIPGSSSFSGPPSAKPMRQRRKKHRKARHAKKRHAKHGRRHGAKRGQAKPTRRTSR